MPFLTYHTLAEQALQQEDQLTIEQRQSLLMTKGYNHFYTLSLAQLRNLCQHLGLQQQQGHYPKGVYLLLVSFLQQRIRNLERSAGEA